MPFHFDINKSYKIWFSLNPELFINMENQIRLIKMREKNPFLIISLVYSSECLSSPAQEELKRFCRKFNISAIDFDSLGREKPLSTDNGDLPFDEKIFQLAKQEIIKARTNSGGNMAAASDLARVIGRCANLGIYADFDVELDLKLNSKVALGGTPLLFPAKDDVFNNELIACASVDGKLHEDVRYFLNLLQGIMVQNYESPLEDILPRDEDPLFNCLLAPFHKGCKKDIFAYRHYLEHFTFNDWVNAYKPTTGAPTLEERAAFIERLQEHPLFESCQPSYDEPDGIFFKTRCLAAVKHLLYLVTVTYLTGPTTFIKVLFQLNGYDKNLRKILEKWAVENSFLANNYKTSHIRTEGCFDDVGDRGGDLSWTSEGLKKQSIRESQIDTSVRMLQRFFKNHTRLVKDDVSRPKTDVKTDGPGS